VQHLRQITTSWPSKVLIATFASGSLGLLYAALVIPANSGDFMAMAFGFIGALMIVFHNRLAATVIRQASRSRLANIRTFWVSVPKDLVRYSYLGLGLAFVIAALIVKCRAG
jgi:hypothetical protein